MLTSIRGVWHGGADRVGAFHDRHPRVGPVIFTASALYFFVQIVVAWVVTPPYSLIRNTISDLGNTACTKGLCSPRHVLMNVDFIYLGAVMIAGSTLLYHEFRERGGTEQNAAFVGFLLMAVGGLGTIIVGAFPENTVSVLHITGAAMAIGGGNFCIFILGAVLKLPESMRRYMLVFSITSLTAGGLFASHKYFGIGAGSMERIAAYPETVWLITFGLFIWRYHPEEPFPIRRRNQPSHDGE